MATSLLKPISRQTVRTRASKNGRLCYRDEAGRPIIVTLDPAEQIILRVKGTKKRYCLHITAVFELAKTNTLISEYNEKVQKYKMEKNAGLRRKKPKQPALPFSKTFFQILK